jgi:hypothetical protein
MPDFNQTSPEINSIVTPTVTVTHVPQFATAEYAHIPGNGTLPHLLQPHLR